MTFNFHYPLLYSIICISLLVKLLVIEVTCTNLLHRLANGTFTKHQEGIGHQKALDWASFFESRSDPVKIMCRSIQITPHHSKSLGIIPLHSKSLQITPHQSTSIQINPNQSTVELAPPSCQDVCHDVLKCDAFSMSN